MFLNYVIQVYFSGFRTHGHIPYVLQNFSYLFHYAALYSLIILEMML